MNAEQEALVEAVAQKIIASSGLADTRLMVRVAARHNARAIIPMIWAAARAETLRIAAKRWAQDFPKEIDVADWLNTQAQETDDER